MGFVGQHAEGIGEGVIRYSSDCACAGAERAEGVNCARERTWAWGPSGEFSDAGV